MTNIIKRFVPTVARFIPTYLDVRDKNVQGFYVAAAGLSADWRGCAVMQSFDNGQTWLDIARLRTPSVLGRVVEVWDNDDGGGIIVRTLHPAQQLESATSVQIDAGANRAAVGNTILSYEHAHLIDVQTYSLTGLKLGYKQTPLIALKAGMGFTQLNINNLARVDCLDDRARVAKYLVLSMGQKINDDPMASFDAFCDS